MIKALLLSLSQLSDPRILLLLLKILVLSLVLFALFGIGAYFGLVAFFAYMAWDQSGFAAATAAAIIAILTAILLFRIVAIFVLNIFSDEVVDAVEARYYPLRAAEAKPLGHWVGLKMGLASAGRAIGYNLLAAPVYIVLLVTGIGAPIAFFAVNAILLGRDLQDMVAVRHADDKGRIAGEWQIRKATRFGLGLITALLFVVPFVNFLAPILGAAMATHLVHIRREVGPIKDDMR